MGFYQILADGANIVLCQCYKCSKKMTIVTIKKLMLELFLMANKKIQKVYPNDGMDKNGILYILYDIFSYAKYTKIF